MGENGFRAACSIECPVERAFGVMDFGEIEAARAVGIDVFVRPTSDPAALSQRVCKLDAGLVARAAGRGLTDDFAVGDNFQPLNGKLRLNRGRDFQGLRFSRGETELQTRLVDDQGAAQAPGIGDVV